MTGRPSTTDDPNFEPSGEPLAVFRREAGSKAAGCLVYTVVTPFVALFLALITAMPLAFALQQLGMSEESSKSAFPILLVPFCLGTMIWGIREYRGRASTEVAIYRDSLVARIGGARHSLPFAEVKAVRLAPVGMDMACILVPKSGQPLRLPPEVAPCSVVRAALEATVIRGLARQVGHQIEAGGSVEVIESGARSTFIVSRGLMLITVGLLLVVTLRHARRGIVMVQHGRLIANLGWVGLRGGFVVEADGVRSLGGEARDSIPWDQMILVQADLNGIALVSKDGRSVVASPFAEGFWPVAAWVASRIS